MVHERVMKNRESSVEEYVRKNKTKMIDYNFRPGEYVLVLNKTKPAKDEGRKGRASYLGPWIVVYRLRSGAYRLAELNGAVSRLKFAAFRLVPYYPRNRKVVPVTKIVDSGDLENLGDGDDDEDVVNGEDDEF